MRITESGSGGGGSGGGSRYYDIVVGNAAAGDTLAICDVLDIGDGNGWKAALAMAATFTPKKSVFTRRGLYDLDAATASPGPITVPAGVLNVCDGVSETLVLTAKDAAKNGLAAFDVFGELRDAEVVFNNPTSINASAAFGVVNVETGGIVRRVRLIAFPVTTPARLGAIIAGIYVVGGGFTEDTNVIGFPSSAPSSVGASSYFVAPPAGANVDITRLVRPRASGDSTGVGGAVGIYVRNVSHVMIEEPEIIDPLVAGIFVQAEEVSRIDVQITDPRVVWRYADTVFAAGRSGIVVQANQALTALGVMDSVRVTRGFFDNFAIHGTGSRAIQFLAIGAGFISVVKNCEVVGAVCRSFDEGARAQGTGISVVDANGVVDSDVGQNTTGINNVNDVNFRALGNW